MLRFGKHILFILGKKIYVLLKIEQLKNTFCSLLMLIRNKKLQINRCKFFHFMIDHCYKDAQVFILNKLKELLFLKVNIKYSFLKKALKKQF